MGTLEYILGCRKIIISREMLKTVVHNLKQYLLPLFALDEKFLEIAYENNLILN
jgi:hypothetical protein